MQILSKSKKLNNTIKEKMQWACVQFAEKKGCGETMSAMLIIATREISIPIFRG
jgi:hypothetical protein